MPAPKDPEKYEEWRRKIAEAAEKRKGRKMPPRTEEWRRKQSEALKGRKMPPRTEEHRANLSASQKGQKRQPLSAEHKAKLSQIRQGQQPSPQTFANNPSRHPGTPEYETWRQSMKGIKHTPEHIEKVAQANRGKPSKQRGIPRSIAAKAKMSAALKGRTFSETTKAKMAAAKIGKPSPWRGKRRYEGMTEEEKMIQLAPWIEAGRRNRGTTDTSIERFAAQQLDAFQIVYEQQKRIGVYAVDFFVPADNLIIEVNGCFWHGCEECGFDKEIHRKRREKDVKRLAYLESKGYTVGIVWEHDLRPYMDEA